MEHCLAGGSQGGDGAPMERIVERDDFVPALAIRIKAVFAGGLDGAFIGFGAGIAEKDALHAGFFTELLRQNNAGLRIVQVGSMV